MTLSLVAITAAALVALLVAEHREADWGRLVKVLASTGFIGVALSSGAADSAYGRLILLALTLSWFGDLFLTYRTPTAFLAGLVLFLVAHLGYVAAFVIRGVAWPAVATTAVIVAIMALTVWRWLRLHLDERMRGPVVAYIVVISAMVTVAAGSVTHEPSAAVGIGAVAFYVSDLAVARNRFVSEGFVNRAWGLPLYYLAQVSLALSTAMV